MLLNVVCDTKNILLKEIGHIRSPLNQDSVAAGAFYVETNYERGRRGDDKKKKKMQPISCSRYFAV